MRHHYQIYRVLAIKQAITLIQYLLLLDYAKALVKLKEAFKEGKDVALYTDPKGKTYAYVATKGDGWHVVDVTDPEKPVTTFSFRPPGEFASFSYRGVAVDPERKILAITEDIRSYTDRNIGGYVRFYDLRSPFAPERIGQEKLTAQYEGVPGKVVMYNGYAYVATALVGLQVVDVNVALNYNPFNPPEPGAAVVNTIDTFGLGYGNPRDIVVYKPGNALLTASSGHLVVLDLANPAYPLVAGVVEPTWESGSGGFEAIRAGAAADFTYLDDEGVENVMDLAVTGGKFGGINVVNLSIPEIPYVISTVSDENNQPLKVDVIFDIAVSKKNGLAFVVSGPRIYIIDIKDPFAPRLLNVLSDVGGAEDNVITMSLGYNVAIEEKDNYLYTANLNTGAELIKIKPFSGGRLIPDYNHDRTIDDSDRARATFGDTFYFWINDDDDWGETGGTDIPGVKSDDNNYLDSKAPDFEIPGVDGVRDLVDFFPVNLNLKDLVKEYKIDSHNYILKASGDNLNVVFTNLTGGNAGEYLTGSADDIETARTLGTAVTYKIPATGVTLNKHGAGSDFLNAIGDEKSSGVILLEGRKAMKTDLVLEIRERSSGNPVFSDKLVVSLAGVEDMFRHKNFNLDVDAHHVVDDRASEYGLDKNVGVESRLDEPANYPDSETNGKNFLFLHGYNVNGQSARGVQSEIFKRMYWSGSKAKFWGITWYGWHTQDVWVEGMVTLPATPNYHINAMHALDTADWLQLFIQNNMKGEIAIAAHSLGNMVASKLLSDKRAIWDNYNDSTDENAPKIKNYFMIDAAVASEAYDYQGPEHNHASMTHPAWKNYSSKLYSSEWHTLFTDDRAKLTWRDRFFNRPGTVDYTNFYSEGEDVLAEHSGSLTAGAIDMLKESGLYAWALQEKLKGLFPLGWLDGGGYFGWTFNLEDHRMEGVHMPTPPVQANQLSGEILKRKPFFKKGDKDDVLFEDNPGSHVNIHRNRLLAEAIPARTLAAGKNKVCEECFSEEIDMQAKMKTDKGSVNNKVTYWPAIRSKDERWQHSDLKDVSYIYVYKLFDEMKKLGGLDK